MENYLLTSNLYTYSGTVFLHWMGKLVILGLSPREKTVLANIKIKAP